MNNAFLGTRLVVGLREFPHVSSACAYKLRCFVDDNFASPLSCYNIIIVAVCIILPQNGCQNNFLRKTYESTSLASHTPQSQGKGGSGDFTYNDLCRAPGFWRDQSASLFLKRSVLPIATLRITRLQSSYTTENNFATEGIERTR